MRDAPGSSSLLVAFTLLSAFTLLLDGCGGPSGSSGGCHYETWQGKCQLQNVRTARVVERFPKSYVVVESTYEPMSTEGTFSPPPFRRETLAPAEQEMDLTNHIKQYPQVDCAVQNPIGDPCSPKMTAAIPEFIAQNVQAPTGPVGCAKIEHSSGNQPVPASAALPGPFQFDENSSVASPDAIRIADEAARAILQNPRIECVAIRGMSAPGESFTLANERAQAVRHLLETRGVAHTNVTVFEATAPSHTAAPDDQPVLAEHRRVHLSVVVYGGGNGP